jgi:hypothetical protein
MASKSMAALSIAFGANTKGFDRAMKKAQAKMKKFGNGMKKLGKTVTMGLTAPLLAFAGASIKAFDTQAKAEASLLTALGGRVDVQQRLIKQAQELQKLTLFGDEETIAAQSLLAQMGLEEDAIIRLMPLIQDMAAAKGMQLRNAADLVAKSVGSSTNALSRYGLTITGAVGSTERLDTAVEALSKGFKGQAETAASVGAGALVQLKNQLGDISEEIGEQVLPHVLKLVNKIKSLADKFSSLSDRQKANIVKWGGIAAAIGPVITLLGMLSIALSALVANPLLILAGAIGVVVTKFVAAHFEANRFTDEMAAVNAAIKDATHNIADEKLAVEELTAVIKDETRSQEEKETALKTLKEISDEYFGSLTTAKEDIVKLDLATKDYIETLFKEAKAVAFREKMIDLEKKRLDLLEEIRKEEEKHEKKVQDLRAPTRRSPDGNTLMNPNADDFLSRWAQGRVRKDLTNSENALKNLEKQIESLKKAIGDEGIDLFAQPTETKKKKKGGGDPVLSPAEIAHNEMMEQLDIIKEFNKRKEYLNKQSGLTEAEQLKKQGEFLKSIAGKHYDDMLFLLEETKEKELNFNKEYWDTMGQQLATGAENLDEYVANVKRAAKEAIGAAIAQGVATAITKSLEGSFLTTPWMIPIIAGLGAGIAKSAFNSLIPSFAEGGLVSRPTLAMVGDSPHGPEMIMPINKLKAMMGSQNQNITVTGRISGTDIFLSNQRTANNRKRGI